MTDVLKTALEKFKALLFAETTAPLDPAEPLDKKEDKAGIEVVSGGITYLLSALEVGGTVEIESETGDYSPANDVELTDSEGTSIVVTGGLISGVIAPQEQAKETPAIEAENPDTKAADIAALQSTIAELQTELAELKGGTAAKMAAMFELIEAVTNESEAEPTGAKKAAFKVVNTAKALAAQKVKAAFAAAK